MSESTKDFQTLLDTIASGVYGKDVRGAIHDALEAMNQRIGEVKPQTGGKQKTVYCWGDSLTQGIGGNVNGWHLISYPGVLYRLTILSGNQYVLYSNKLVVHEYSLLLEQVSDLIYT